jgi:signal transduction histidine kinase
VKTHLHIQKDGLLRVEMAPETLRLLLYILTQNALDWFQTTSSPFITISVSSRPGTVEILFSDNGPGLPRGVEDRIFQPAFSLKEAGEGMGLTIARQIVRSHGGTIHAISDRRRNGATFLVVLPRRRSRAT